MLDKLRKGKTAKGLASIIAPLILASGISLTSCYRKIVMPTPIKKQGFSFLAVADPQGHDIQFKNLMIFSQKLEPKAYFLVSVGDLGNVESLDDIIDDYYETWYPVVGNHDFENPESMESIAKIFARLPNIVNKGPTGDRGTIYSFDHGNAHFIVLDGYYQGWDGNIHNDPKIDDPQKDQYDWLKDDLGKTDKKFKFVFVHEPAYPQTRRHFGGSLNRYKEDRDALWKLLAEHGVTAFFSGHTHEYAKDLIDNVWHINAGRACNPDNSLVYVFVSEDEVTFRAYKAGKKLKNMRLLEEWAVKK